MPLPQPRTDGLCDADPAGKIDGPCDAPGVTDVQISGTNRKTGERETSTLRFCSRHNQMLIDANERAEEAALEAESDDW